MSYPGKKSKNVQKVYVVKNKHFTAYAYVKRIRSMLEDVGNLYSKVSFNIKRVSIDKLPLCMCYINTVIFNITRSTSRNWIGEMNRITNTVLHHGHRIQILKSRHQLIDIRQEEMRCWYSKNTNYVTDSYLNMYVEYCDTLTMNLNFIQQHVDFISMLSVNDMIIHSNRFDNNHHCNSCGLPVCCRTTNQDRYNWDVTKAGIIKLSNAYNKYNLPGDIFILVMEYLTISGIDFYHVFKSIYDFDDDYTSYGYISPSSTGSSRF